MKTQVAVVIPCLDEAAYIGRCLDSLSASDYPASLLEVYVCDGGSKDGTQEIVLRHAAQSPGIVLLENRERTTPYALNLGIEAARDAGIIIILGAHAEVSSNYISECVAVLNQDPSVGCVGGVLENIAEDKRTQAISMAMSSSFGVGNAHFRTGASDGYVDTVAFGAYRKTVFDTCGLFDTELTRNQDDEFNYRISRAGFRCWLSTAIHAKYYVRSSYRKLFRQYFQYGYWKVYVNRKHKAVTSVRQLVPAAFVLCLAALVIGWLAWPPVALLLAPVLVLYVLLGMLAALARTRNAVTMAKIIFAFAVLHIAYGSGYLKGIWDFIIRGGKKPVHHAGVTR